MTISFEPVLDAPAFTHPQQPIIDRLEVGECFAVPAHLLETHHHALMERFGASCTLKTITVEGYNIQAYLFSAEDPAGAHIWPQLFGTGGIHQLSNELLSFHEVWVGDDRMQQRIPLVTKLIADRILLVESEESRPGSAADKVETRRHIKEIYYKFLLRLEAFTGWRARLYSEAPEVVEPFPPEPRLLHILAWAAPSGDRRHHTLRHVFGRKLDENFEELRCTAATRGRGIVLKDAMEQPVIQLIDTTAYVLFPMFSSYHGRESNEIFTEMLRTLWNHLHREQQKEDTPTQTDAELLTSAVDVMGVFTANFAEYWQMRGNEQEQKIAKLQEDLAHAQSALLQLRACEHAVIGQVVEPTRNRTLADLNRIAAHPLVRRVFGHEEAVHIESNLIVIEHEEKRYPIGRFMIRIDGMTLFIWAVERLHPRGIPHPHLRLQGVPCYGSATTAITEALSQFQLARTATFVLSWLVDGYTPATCSTKVEEWNPEPLCTEMSP